MLSNAIEETYKETIETPNPTSIEFEGYFTDAMKEALDADKRRRILLVLDNLDRVDPEDAIGIWSTLQTFLQECGHRDDTWFEQLWVLVPYDPKGLRKLWENRGAGKRRDVQDQPNKDESASHTSAVEDDLASGSFLDKSFQIRFRVPPPVHGESTGGMESIRVSSLTFPLHRRRARSSSVSVTNAGGNKEPREQNKNREYRVTKDKNPVWHIEKEKFV